MRYCVVIPARLKSTRFPAKPLAEILGYSMIQRTFNQVSKCINPNLIYIATDSTQIKDHCLQFTKNIFVTEKNCATGTDRVSEFAKSFPNFDYYINVQGDEPIINPEDILKIVKMQKKYPDDVINGYAPILIEEDYRSLSVPKMVISQDDELIYSSRSSVPGNKNNTFISGNSHRQICIYSFPKKALSLFGSGKVKTKLEEVEDIEILRFLENGVRVKMIKCSGESIAVDTKDDLQKVIKILESR